VQNVEVVGTDQVVEPFIGLLYERDDFGVSVEDELGDGRRDSGSEIIEGSREARTNSFIRKFGVPSMQPERPLS
jgi:hypothetical protein